jgi:RNA polymerase sigma-70 factor (ECF subfamily)
MPELPDFAEFYGASFGPLCVQLYAHTGDHSEAQDVVQEAFCRALARWPRISRYDDPAAWVRKVAWNLATSRWRKVRANRVYVNKSAQEELVPGPDVEHLDVIALLKTLPERQRQAVVMHYLSDIPVAEIATMTGAAEGTVKSWLHRARTTLDSRLRGAEWPAPIPPGSDTARQTVRRRRDRNALATIIALVCAAVTALLVPYISFRDEPITKITPSPSVSASLEPSTGPEVQLVQPGAVPSSSPAASCVSDPVGLTTQLPSGTSVAVKWMEARTGSTTRPLCPGVRLKLNWASYTVDSQMNATLYRSGSVYLDGKQGSAVINVIAPPGCHLWYVTGSDIPIPGYIDAAWRQMSGRAGPFWDEKHQQRGVIAERQVWQCPSA